MELRFGRLRPSCPQCGHTVFIDPKVAVCACVTRVNSSGERELLLIQRANDPGRGKWSVPAGFIEPDEDPRRAAERETFEETGLIVSTDRLVDILHRPDPDGLADLVILYTAEIVGGELRAGDDAEAAAWFSRNDPLPEIAFRSAELFIGWWKAGKI